MRSFPFPHCSSPHWSKSTVIVFSKFIFMLFLPLHSIIHFSPFLCPYCLYFLKAVWPHFNLITKTLSVIKDPFQFHFMLLKFVLLHHAHSELLVFAHSFFSSPEHVSCYTSLILLACVPRKFYLFYMIHINRFFWRKIPPIVLWPDHMFLSLPT